jgi:hypothetical protein
MLNIRTCIIFMSLVDFLSVDTEQNIGFWKWDALL